MALVRYCDILPADRVFYEVQALYIYIYIMLYNIRYIYRAFYEVLAILSSLCLRF
jgi:hypothetical protein